MTGDELRALRKEHGISRSEMAHIAYLSHKSVTAYEQGLRHMSEGTSALIRHVVLGEPLRGLPAQKELDLE